MRTSPRLILVGLTAVLISLLTATVALAQATTTTTSFEIPYNPADAFIPCANGGVGDTVHVSGTIHGVSSTTTNSKGTYVRTLFNPNGVTGVGLSTGNRYQITGVFEENYFIPAGSTSPQVYTLVIPFHYIGQGTAADSLFHAILHVTVNANGQVTANVSNSSLVCK